MKQRGKEVETKLNPPEYNYSATDLIPCKKHPSSSVGICAYCLKERLIELVCSDCGEQRLSSCSCSDISSNRNSSATDIGGVGRISFLIENDRNESRSKPAKSEEGFLVKRRGGIWRIVRLFGRKKREKGGCSERRSVGDGNETWVFDYVGVSRSRSLCSFRGGSFREESGSEFAFSSAKVSDFNGNSSGLDSERPSGFSETEPRKMGLKDSDFGLSGTKRSVFPVKESEFGELGEAGFIDLKLDLETESRKAECSVLKGGDLNFPVSVEDFGGLGGGGEFLGKHEKRGIFRRGGSCRITVNETGIKRDKRGYRGWRWIFRQHPNWRSASKKDEVLVVRT